MAGTPRYEYPPDEVLEKAVEAEGVKWLADELGIPEGTLRSHLRRQGLPTSSTRKLEMTDALKRVAGLVKS